jgi:hypothetical protein
MKLLLAFALLAACHRVTPREDDCAFVRQALAHESGVDEQHQVLLYDPEVVRMLRSHVFHAPKIAAVALSAGSAAGSADSRHAVDYVTATSKLRELCQ